MPLRYTTREAFAPELAAEEAKNSDGEGRRYLRALAEEDTADAGEEAD